MACEKKVHVFPHFSSSFSNTAIAKSLEPIITKLFEKDDVLKQLVGLPLDHKVIEKHLPIISFEPTIYNENLSIEAYIIAPSTNTIGLGRYLTESIASQIVVGSRATITGLTSVGIKFNENESSYFYFQGMSLLFNSKEEYDKAISNIPIFSKELALTILGVRYSRLLVSKDLSSKKGTPESIIAYIQSLVNKVETTKQDTVFELANKMVVTIKSDIKKGAIQADLTPRITRYISKDSRDFFVDFHLFVAKLRPEFVSARSIKQLTKIASYIYILQQIVVAHGDKSGERSVLVKTLKIKNENPSLVTLGLCVGIAKKHDNQFFTLRHLENAISDSMPQANIVPNSVVDFVASKTASVIYIELSVQAPLQSSLSEINAVIEQSVISNFEEARHHIFVQKNGEEILRNIVTLSGELKYVNDIPQQILSFHRQTNSQLVFSVVITRLLKDGDLSLSNMLLSIPYPISSLETKKVGKLRNKYVKEAASFDISIPKAPHFRKDFSVDLNAARSQVSSSLRAVFGDIRDYNGGMISKMNDNYRDIAFLFSKESKTNLFIIENFFYEMTPSIMQGIISPQLFKSIFVHCSQKSREIAKDVPYTFSIDEIDSYDIMTICCTHDNLPKFKSVVNNATQYESLYFHSFFSTVDRHCLCIAMQKYTKASETEIYKALQSVITTIV